MANVKLDMEELKSTIQAMEEYLDKYENVYLPQEKDVLETIGTVWEGVDEKLFETRLNYVLNNRYYPSKRFLTALENYKNYLTTVYNSYQSLCNNAAYLLSKTNY